MNNKVIAVNKYEKKVFRFGVMITLFLFPLRLVQNLIIGAEAKMIGFYILMTFLFSFIYYLQSRKYKLATILFYTVGTIEIFSAWNVYGGWSGSVPYTIFLFVVFIIITSHRWVLIGALSLVALGLLFADNITLFNPNLNYNTSTLVFDFLLNTAIISIIVYFLKIFFFREKKRYEKTNAKLIMTTEELSMQGRLLKHQTEEMRQAENDYEQLVQSTFMEVQESNKLLQEYGFTNSHIVRSPLSNVLGLIHLLEQESPDHPDMATFQKIKAETLKMDSFIKEAAHVVNISRQAS